MAKYYVLIKKKGSSRWLGAIPARNGVSLSKLRSSLSKGSKQYSYKIVTMAQLKRIIGRLKPKGTMRRKTSKRRSRRVKRRSKRRSSRSKMKRRRPMRVRRLKLKMKRRRPMKRRRRTVRRVRKRRK